jgi:hypothetical protein
MTSNVPAPAAKTIYDDLDPTQDLSRVNGDPIFGFYPKPEAKTKSFLLEFAKAPEHWKSSEAHSTVPYPEFDRAITSADIENLTKAAASQEVFASSPRLSAAVMGSTKAFTEITKQEFAKAHIEAIQQPQCAGFFAVVAMGRVLKDLSQSFGHNSITSPGNFAARTAHPELLTQIGLLASVAYNLKVANPSDFLMSAQFFRANEWEKAPLTAEEVLAIPFVLGELAEVYAEVEHDLGRHAESCAKKLESAGYHDVAAYIHKDLALKAEASKPQRKHEDPGLGM